MLKSDIKLIGDFFVCLLYDIASQCFDPKNLPMCRHIPKPINTGRLERNIRIQAARDGAMDDDLLLLVQ